ncbi:MAG: hypothetical protein LBJ02_08055 [Bifidobacteriaceae bacterium]|jgi:predicted nucleic acid-binding protein|nr:hypothetical protein [Bifidobacteriaceae bacterium]
MRTTVTLTPETEALIKTAMAESDRSFKDVVNDAIVTALAPGQTRPLRTKTRALNDIGLGGNLVNDAYLAALALACGGAVVSFDSDFARFPDLE